MNKVAITGMGIVSVLGTGTAKVAESLKSGRSGIRFLPERLEMGFRSGLSGVIDDFKTPADLSRKQRKTMTEYGLHAYAAAKEALAMSGWGENEVQSDMTGIIIGNDSSGLANVEQVDVTRREKSTFPIGSGLVFQSLTSTVTMNFNTIFKTRGACWSISAACSSGGHALGQAAELIACGRQHRMICGGVQEMNWESVASFDATNAFSIRHDEPEQASRPFDRERDGLIPSGGAAVLLLENYDMAVKRGAEILGELLAYEFSSDGTSLSVPSGEGLKRCISGCIRRAGIMADDVDYVCAHATSTPLGDAVEARALYDVFGRDMPWVSSTKSMTGHEMWMSGAAQAVYSLIMSGAGFIAPNINFSSLDDDIPPVRIAAETIDEKVRMILLNSAGFGGTNCCVLLKGLR